jgi:large-conductance mechanosensitive channel
MEQLNRLTDNFNVYAQLKNFVMENNTVGTIAGVCIGAASKDFILSLVGNVVLPNCNRLLLQIPYKPFIKLLPAHLPTNYTIFFTQLITWILVVLSTMLFIKLAFNSILGINKTNTTINKTTKAGSKAAATKGDTTATATLTD